MNSKITMMAVLAFGVLCSEAEAGCGAKSKHYIQQTANISAQALPCTKKQGDNVQRELVLPKELVIPKPNIHDRTEVSNDRLQGDTTANQLPEESVTIDVHELIKDHWGKGISILAILLMIREKLVAGSVLAASGTIVG